MIMLALCARWNHASLVINYVRLIYLHNMKNDRIYNTYLCFVIVIFLFSFVIFRNILLLSIFFQISYKFWINKEYFKSLYVTKQDVQNVIIWRHCFNLIDKARSDKGQSRSAGISARHNHSSLRWSTWLGQSAARDATADASRLARSLPARDAPSPSPRAPGRRSRPIGGHLLLPREQNDSAFSHHHQSYHKETTSRRARLSLSRDAKRNTLKCLRTFLVQDCWTVLNFYFFRVTFVRDWECTGTVGSDW